MSEKLSEEQILKLPTPRLLNVYRDLQIEAGYDSYDCYTTGEQDDESKHINDRRDFRAAVKAELDTRPHVERTSKKQNHSKPFQSRNGRNPLHDRYRDIHGFWIWGVEPKPEREGSIKENDLEAAIGQQVYKKSKKPFKSKNIYNTVASVTVNPHTKRKAFTFEEDESIVDAHICNIRKKK